MKTYPVDYLRTADSRDRAVMQPELSAWTEAYSRLQSARALVKAAGPKASWQMRDDRDRLQVMAEKALAALNAQNHTSRLQPSQHA